MGKKDFYVAVLALAVAVLLAAGQFCTPAVPAGAWGLSFPEAGQSPRGPVDSGKLREYGGFFMGDPRQKVIYLTFDAGYENGNTAKILDILKKHRVPAAFFLVGNYMEKNADLVRRMVAEGHIVGNHTMHHRDMSKLKDPQVFQKELQEPEALFFRITGRELPRFYRPPQGVYSEENLKMARSMGYRTVFWSLAYCDWNNDAQPGKEQAFEKLLPRIHPGAVVLLHSTSRTNGEILEELITRWKAMGYGFGSLDSLEA